jgi:hypothetical protein
MSSLVYSNIRRGWRTIGENKKYYRSLWEANYARYLEWQKKHGYIKDWKHEPKIFWFLEIKRGCRSYTPDFHVICNDESTYWVEVKGWKDSKSATKLKRFKKYYPEEKMLYVDSKWFKKNNPKMRIIIPTWE